MSRPLIGLSAYREEAAWGAWKTSADLLPSRYSWAVEEAGGVPVLLPPSVPATDAAAAVVARLDALVISGGPDVKPARYGEEPHPAVAGWRSDRDEWELALLDAAETARVPVLGVCRGMQVMAVSAGGTLVQHVPDVVGHTGHNPGGDSFGETSVTVAQGSRLASLVGAGIGVRCHHHQAVSSHPGFEPVAVAGDGTLEAIEAPGERFCVGVQWHPEMAADAGLWRGLVAAASSRHSQG